MKQQIHSERSNKCILKKMFEKLLRFEHFWTGRHVVDFMLGGPKSGSVSAAWTLGGSLDAATNALSPKSCEKLLCFDQFFWGMHFVALILGGFLVASSGSLGAATNVF